MRAHEIILQEDRWDPEYIKHEVLTLLTSVAAEGITQLSPISLLQDLKAMGYPMTMSGLFDLLQGTELVKNMNRDVIELAAGDLHLEVGGGVKNLTPPPKGPEQGGGG